MKLCKGMGRYACLPLLAFSALISTGCSVFGIRTAEELEYTVLEKDKNIEIRRYEPYIVAQAEMSGTSQQVQGDLFRILAGYIFGKNEIEEKIAMTAPVIMDSNREQPKSEKIAMTALVVAPSDQDTWQMSFSMPSEYTMENLPKPVDQRVVLKEIPAQLMAVIRYTGSFSNLEQRKKKAAELMRWLESQTDYQTIADPVFAGYDPPFTIPFLRRNEVLIKIERAD